MKRINKRTGIFRDTTSLAGWLFADLLLGLSMLFFIFNTVGPETPKPTSTPDFTMQADLTAYAGIRLTPSPTVVNPTIQAEMTQFAKIALTPSPTIINPTIQAEMTQFAKNALTPTPTPDLTAQAAVTELTNLKLTPTPVLGIDTNKLPVELQVNSSALTGPDGAVKDGERSRVKGQLRTLFGNYDGHRQAGFVLSFGTAPLSIYYEGIQISGEINRLMKEELPNVFGKAVTRDFYNISDLPANRGLVQIEVYFFLGAS
ncbi:MAG: hypothetical protein BGO39_03375 [Chloroflexi bacterium 54-19]|nr:MAG: hypothetical protein BGO39_03375 [Chloroflexi bacterium 54-19]